MIERLKLGMPVLLPDNGGCPDCVQRLQGALHLHKGIARAHLDQDSDLARLCLHYDPNLISLAHVARIARQEGITIQQHYRHRDLRIAGMDCADCALKLEKGVSRLDGVLHTAVSFTSARMRVEYDVERLTQADIVERIRRLGYDVRDEREGIGQVEPDGLPGFLAFVMQQRRAAVTVVAGALIVLALVMARAGLSASVSHAFYGLAIAVAGFRVARRGIVGAWITRQMDVNLLMTLAALGAVAIGAWEEGALVVFLFGLGETLEEYTMDRARHAIRSLMELAPAEASRLPDLERVPVEDLTLGDLVVVRPGERVPMDGIVRRGTSVVDQAPITGESIPVQMQLGSQIFAGSINGPATLEIEVTHLADDNTISRIVQMVQEAQLKKAPSQRWVDVFARYYTPAVMGLAALIASVPPLFFGQPFLATSTSNGWLYRALALLIIACPCALVISTPVSIISAIASAAQQGVLFKGGAYLEAAGTLRAVAFDKTGTLTHGEPTVTDIIPLPPSHHPTSGHGKPRGGEWAENLLRMAAAAEAASDHPLARAIVRAAEQRDILFTPAREVEALTGRGIRARVRDTQIYVGSLPLFRESAVDLPATLIARGEALEEEGKTVLFVASIRGGQSSVAGLIAVADTVRPDARETIAALRRTGIRRTVMLTGDNERTAAAVAAQAGLDSFHANLLPDGKLDAIDGLLIEYGRVAMVGDGINDAPALARATVGIAMGGAGSDQALETADVALMADALSKLPFAMRLSRRTLRIVRQNIGFSLLVKAAFMALAIPGTATLWMAVLADVGASLIVILNGMRLLRTQP